VTTGLVLGFVGLGNMGQPMAANLVAAGFDVQAFDTAGTVERLPAGAHACSSVAEVAERSDTVLLSLPDGAATRTVTEEIAATAERRAATVIDLSTVGPAVAVEVAAALAAVGAAYADGPVSGGVAGARAATLSLMFAGPADVLDVHRAALDAIAGSVLPVGTRPGQGQAMKLLNNFLSATALAATSEALAFGEAHGLDLAVMLDVLNVSTGRNSATVDKFPNRVLTGTFDAGFRTALMAKDLRLYRDLLAAVGTRADVGRAVAALWQAADDALPGSDFTEIWTFVRDPPPGSSQRTA
jgi:3-hydroxyisobutyrate dehydrogenase-like beta-hydroxyacid dehydrogenase